MDDALIRLARRLRELAERWRTDASQNRNDWADLLEAIAHEVEAAFFSAVEKKDEPK